MEHETDFAALQLARSSYASRTMRLAGVEDPRIEAAFATIPREAFLPPPPWTVISAGAVAQTSYVVDLYDDVLVALDQQRGINNGEPALHAAWLAAVEPQPGESVIHVGAGGGYYTAMLAMLVSPGGEVQAFEIHQELATAAKRNLQSYSNVAVHAGSAFGRALPAADVIYVNAGVVAPDPEWLRALKDGGRLIFPWQPSSNRGTAVLVRRHLQGLSAQPLMNVGFIACSGQENAKAQGSVPSEAAIAGTRSLWLTAERPPDVTATAVYDNVWFSSRAVN